MDGDVTDAVAFEATLSSRQRARTVALAATARGIVPISLRDVMFGLIAASSAATLFLEPRFPAVAALVAAVAVQALLSARTNRRLDALATLQSEGATEAAADRP